MTREELEHIIRASADVTDQYEFVIIGSQSMLGQVPNPEKVFTVSMEADIYPKEDPDLADAIDGAIGEGSIPRDLWLLCSRCRAGYRNIAKRLDVARISRTKQ